MVIQSLKFPTSLVSVLFLAFAVSVYGGEKPLIQLKDFEQVEVKSGGFTLPRDASIHIHAVGAGDNEKRHNDNLFAYGWIIDADSRSLVWKMNYSNTTSEKKDRLFDGEISLPKGSYEVYFAAYGFASHSALSSFDVNIDRRNEGVWGKELHKWGIISWLDEFFGGDLEHQWKSRSKNWGIDLSVNSNDAQNTAMFSPPKDFPNVLFRATRLGEEEHIKQPFTLSRQLTIRIYALGEQVRDDDPADYGWIIDAKTRKRVWAMKSSNTEPAGGAEKNVKVDYKISLNAGNYLLYYITDGSHSYVDWNAAPPNDPYNYGITLLALNETDKNAFSLSSYVENKNVIVQMIKVGDNDHRSASFTLKSDATVRIYALGERGSRREMADYGWIIDAKTREKVWTMDVSKTESAGGASKNRMIDEAITLPKGTYSVFYQSDGSHAYNDWNDDPPYDPEYWGITITAAGDNFDMTKVERNVEPKEANVISQIVRVGNNADQTTSFTLDKLSRVRIFAIGEGESRSMYDYGWIEDASSGKIVWEMTYGMTFHAGGGRKNRLVNTTILLDKGNYRLHYVSDDSHSYEGWNTDPPDDPSMWGITLFKAE